MIFSKRINTLLLVLLSLLNIILRAPISKHEYSTTDSFFIHTLATSISGYGYAKWIIHPLSFIGVYPLSYGSMYPYFLSGSSALMNIPLEYAILISSVALSLFGMLSIYLVAKEVRNDDFFAFLVAFVFSTSPVFFTYTNWTATARSPFIAILPFFIYLITKSHKNFRYAIFTSVFLLLLMTIHQLFYLMPVIISAYLIAIFFSIFRIDEKKITSLRNVKDLTARHHSLYKVVLLVIIIFVSLYLQKGSLVESFSDSAITNSIIEDDFLASIRNLSINYIGKMGLNLFFGFIGIIYLMQSKNLSLKKRFFIISIVLLTFTVSYRYYAPLCYLPFLVIIMGYGIEWVFFRICSYKKISYIFIVLLLVSSVSFSMYMDDHWKKIPTNSAMKDETYNTALFVKGKTNGTIISNEGNIGQQINAISGVPVLPFGVVHWFSPGQLIYDFEDKNNLHPNLLPIENLLPPPDVWYNFNGVSNVKEDYQNIMYSDISSDAAKQNILKYNIKVCVLYKPLENKFVSYGTRTSQFIPSMTEKENKIFDSNTEAIWHLSETG